MRNKTVYTLVSLCFAAIGCYATIAQVMLIREFLNIFYGNELCLGIVFGAWFLGIATGAFAGAKIEHVFEHAATVFVITLMVMCFVLPLQIVFVRGVRGLLSVGVGEYISILPLLLTSIGLILPFSFVIGFIFPFSSKVISGATRDAAVDIGVVYIVESMGSLFGGLLFSFFLVSRFHPFKIITLLNVGMFVLLTLLFFSFQRRKRVYTGGEKNKVTVHPHLNLSSSPFIPLRRGTEGGIQGGNEYSPPQVGGARACPVRNTGGGGELIQNKYTKRVLGFIASGLALVMIVVWFSPIPDRAEVFSSKMRWKTLNPHMELVASAD